MLQFKPKQKKDKLYKLCDDNTDIFSKHPTDIGKNKCCTYDH